MALLSNLYPGIKGAQGIQGTTGAQGTQGTQGIQGIQGVETKGFSVTEVNGPYSLQTSDVGKLIKINSGISTVSISSNTFSFGNSFMVYNGTSNTQTISQGVGVSFYSGDGTAAIGNKTINENEITTILCSSSNDEFIFSGVYTNIETIDIVRDGLVLLLDAGDTESYPGSGTTWTDLSGDGNDGTLVNGPTYSSDNGGYLDFDGSNDYVSFSSSILTSATTEISCFMWVYPVSDGTLLTVLGQTSISSGYLHSAIEIGSSGQLRMGLWNGSSISSISSTLTLNTWNNVGFTYSGTTLTGYLNGSDFGTTSFTWSKPSNIYFGIMAASGTNMGTNAYGDGNVPTFYTYNKALTPSEIEQNFEALRERFGV